MRRFEFESGGSNKFWEIHLEGPQFTVRWGKLGSNGQQQVKTFASDAVAGREHDKLVAEKLGKGYREVGTPAQANKAPTAPSAASAAPAATAAVRDLDKLIRKLIPYRGGPACKPGTDLKKAVARLQEVRDLDARRAVMTGKGVEISAELKPALMERVARPVGDFQPGDPRVEGVFLAMLGHNDRAWDRAHEIGSDLVHLWLSQASPTFALKALLENYPYDDSVTRSGTHLAWGFFPYVGPWRTLRGYLACASPADYQEALEASLEVAESGPMPLRMMLAFAFPGEPTSQETLSECLQQSATFQHVPLLATASDGASFLALAEVCKPYIDHDYLGFKFLDFVPTCLFRLGAEAAPGLLLLARSAEKTGPRRALAELLLHLDTPEVSDFFQEHRKDKVIGPQALSYLDSRSSVAPPAPSQTASPAPACELPPLLASPPWTRSAAKKKTVARKELRPLEVSETVHFAPGQREKILARNELFSTAQEKKIKQEFPNTPYLKFAERLCNLNDREWAVQIWNDTPSDHWNIYSFRSDWDETPQRLLATFGPAALPGLLRIAPLAADKCYPALAMIESGRVASVFADLRLRSKKFRPLAQKWLKSYPEAAAVGLIPPALQASKAELAALRWLAGQGSTDLLLEVARRYGAEAEVSTLLDYDPLLDLPARLPAKPSWWKPERYNRPRLLNGAELPVEAVDHLGTMLSISRLDEPYAGLEIMRQCCQARSLEDFAWSTYQSWLQAGGPAKEDWGFLVLAYFGGDEAARRLTPELRRWPGEGLSSRAALGLEVLGKIGSDVALMHLHGIALKLRFKALQDKARSKIEEIAEERGLSLDELADRLVPDLDLDPQGRLWLDFGSRRFQARFDEQLRPTLFDAEGRPLKDLPAPGKQDDAALASAAVENWKALKKDLKTIASTQLQRLEQALSRRRRWKFADFELLLAGHPLLGHLVRRLLWASYSEDGSLSIFRVAEDGSLADRDDRPMKLPSDAVVGLVHPLEANLTAWTEVFDDYQIVQPFPQVHRAVFHGPPPDFNGRKARPGRILRLEKQGWHRGDTESGCLMEYVKKLCHGQARLEILDGGYLEELPRNTVEVGSLRLPEQLDPVELSEILYDLHQVFEDE